MSTSAKDLWPDPQAGNQPKLTLVALDICDAAYADDGCYCGQQGWARFTKGVQLTKGLTAEKAATLGTMLYAEWVDEIETPWRIAPDPAAPGAFRKITFREGSGDTYLKESITVFGDRSAHEHMLKFDVYWNNPPDGAVSRAFDVFTGFAPKGAK
jgi:hypothetical protein